MSVQPRSSGMHVEGWAHPNRRHPMRPILISCLALAVAAGAVADEDGRAHVGVIDRELGRDETAHRLAANMRAGGLLHSLAVAADRRLVFFCAFGERSAMAVQAAQDAGLASACHIEGGIDAWNKAAGPLTH